MANLNYQHGKDASQEKNRDLRIRWFGPSKADVWKCLAEETHARYEKGSWTKGDRVIAESGHWQIVLDAIQTDKVSYTRIRAPYVNADGFRFCIFNKHLFSGLAEVLGFQDVRVGFDQFDEHFIIRGNHEDKLKQLFSNAKIRELLDAQKHVRFEVIDDEGFFRKKFPEGVDELRFMVGGIIKDVDRLKALYELFAETLNELCRMGSAYDVDPQVQI